jgi:hypothetical protein
VVSLEREFLTDVFHKFDVMNVLTGFIRSHSDKSQLVRNGKPVS